MSCACPGLGSNSRPYAPSTEQEREVFFSAHRDVFPDDVRRDLDAHRTTLLAWVGIITSARWLDRKQPTAEFLIEHHYWDWIEDHSVQREVAFLSPRGEGPFSCVKTFVKPSAKSKVVHPLPPPGSMAIVYGYPEAVRAQSEIVDFRCVAISTAPPEWYGTDIWDYGRNYLLHGDESDLKVLRVPF
jgi:hypothetical protein